MSLAKTPQAGQQVRLFSEAGALMIKGVVTGVEGGSLTVHPDPASPMTGLARGHLHALSLEWESDGETMTGAVDVEGRGEDGSLEMSILIDERRESVRVPANLTMSYEIISPEDFEREKRQIDQNTGRSRDLVIEADNLWRQDDLATQVEEHFSQLTRLIQEMNAKIDYLIASRDGQDAAAPLQKTVHLVSISGLGLSFQQAMPMEKGTLLKMTLEMNRFPRREITCIGQVVRNEPGPDNQAIIGVRFESIHKDDRERIYRFISRVERHILRERREKSI